LLVLGVFIFAGGVAVGKGDLQINGLSKKASPANSNLAYKLDYSTVEQVYDLLRQDFDGKLDQEKLLDGLKSGLAGATGDPYTQYFNAKDAKDFNDALNGSFTGIGAELGTNDDKLVVVVSPLSGYPAEAAGLKPKDIIAAIDGVPTSGMSVDAVVRKIRGPADTKVVLTVVRGDTKAFDVSITRTKITVPSVKAEIINGVGYLKINQFTADTITLAQAAAQDFKDKKVTGVVLDLRGNPGGYLSGAVGISSLWLDKGQTVVSEHRGKTVSNTQYATGDNILKGIKTIVLINGGSASSSEITAGALHDNNVAKLVGEQSFGKGSVQQIENLAGGAEIKITIAHWYTPGGKNINKQGIKPDTEIKNTDADFAAGKDPQKDKAFELVKQ
jgi:carboxyl-terminal processing protease